MNELQKDQKRGLRINNLPLTTLGWELALPIFGGALLGYALDKALQTNYALTLILIIFGIFVGYYNLYKLIELEMLRIKSAQTKQKGEDSKS